ncbi:hypothetical protein KSF78_0002753 [Schistosoma japonicum]|uniref:Clone ZZD1477 mRNA sequence n=1 Tax=Schistosoma japonicum TaxID=6182 RepID=Q86FE5_SCHJA|nr:hypothetical protein [Schistosoma japonicum]KAH8863618.1 hypothetical protein KSF78_0002753 [Schistosoma japonicum]KAH8863619.1 hypothetical protein KSF78_0002753 [Schistosoma japonicum]
MELSRSTKIFTFIGLAILLSFTLTAMIQDDTLTAQNKSHATKTFQAFYFIAFFSFIAALILYLVIIFVKDLRLLKFGFVGALVVGCFCSIISVIMYYDNLSRYYNATIRPDTSSWLLVVIVSAFQLCLFAFMYILY